MKVKIKKIIVTVTSFLLSAITLFSTAACGGKPKSNVVKMTDKTAYTITEKVEPEPYVSVYYEITGGKDVMPIGGFFGPWKSGGSANGNDTADMSTEDIVKDVVDCGINLIVYSGTRYEWSPLTVEKLLQYGEKHGLGFFVNSQYVQQKVGESRNPAPLENIDMDELYQKIMETSFGFRYKSFLGYQFGDELFPTNQLRNAIKLANAMRELNLPIDIYSNAHGYFDGTAFGWFGLSNASYDEYMEMYKGLGVKIFSNTTYPYETVGDKVNSGPTDEHSNETLANCFVILNQMREMSIENDMAMWRMAQAGHQFESKVESNPYAPSEGEFLFDANASVMFGAKGIQYYTCVSYPTEVTLPDGSYDARRNGLIGVDGKKNQWWYYLKKFTTQIKAVDHIIMNSASMGFIPHGDGAEVLIKNIKDQEVILNSFRQLKGIYGDSCFVGCFDYLGGSAYFVVNASRNNKAEVTLDFDGYYGYDVIQRGETVSVVGTTMDLIMQPGEAVMVVLR